MLTAGGPPEYKVTTGVLGERPGICPTQHDDGVTTIGGNVGGRYAMKSMENVPLSTPTCDGGQGLRGEGAGDEPH